MVDAIALGFDLAQFGLRPPDAYPGLIHRAPRLGQLLLESPDAIAVALLVRLGRGEFAFSLGDSLAHVCDLLAAILALLPFALGAGRAGGAGGLDGFDGRCCAGTLRRSLRTRTLCRGRAGTLRRSRRRGRGDQGEIRTDRRQKMSISCALARRCSKNGRRNISSLRWANTA